MKKKHRYSKNWFLGLGSLLLLAILVVIGQAINSLADMEKTNVDSQAQENNQTTIYTEEASNLIFDYKLPSSASDIDSGKAFVIQMRIQTPDDLATYQAASENDSQPVTQLNNPEELVMVVNGARCFNQVVREESNLYWQNSCRGIPSLGGCLPTRMPLSSSEQKMLSVWEKSPRPEFRECVNENEGDPVSEIEYFSHFSGISIITSAVPLVEFADPLVLQDSIAESWEVNVAGRWLADYDQVNKYLVGNPLFRVQLDHKGNPKEMELLKEVIAQ